MAMPDALSPLSGIPPEAWLSGLPLGSLVMGGGQEGLSGMADPGSGDGGGMQGGLSLDELNQLLLSQQEASAGPGTDQSLLTGLQRGSIGQGSGYIAAGGAMTGMGKGPQPREGYVQAGAQMSNDPLAELKQALSLVSRGAGVVDKFGVGGYQVAGQGGEIDTAGLSLDGTDGATAESVLSQGLGQNPLGGTSIAFDPGLAALTTQMLLEGSLDPSWFTRLSEQPGVQQGFMDALRTGVTQEGIDPTGLGLIDTNMGYASPGSAPPVQPGATPQQQGSVPGAIGAGASGMLGLINLLQGLQNEEGMQALSGGLQAGGGLVGLLQKSPDLAGALGVTPDMISAGGNLLGGAGGLLGLFAGGKQLSEGNPMGVTTSLSGGLGTYNALASLGIVPELASLLPALGTPGLTAAGGAAAGGAAAGSGGGATAATVAPSMAAGLMAVPLLLPALGAALHPFFEKWDQPGLKRRNEMRNNAAVGGFSNALINAIGGTDDPARLLGIAGLGPQIGQGQVQFHWNGHHGGDYDDPMSQGYQEALGRAATGDPEAIGDFIRGLTVSTGQTGIGTTNDALTDYYRREMAHAAGLKDTTGLFTGWDPARQLTSYLMSEDYGRLGGNWETAMPFLEQLLGGGLKSVSQYLGPSKGIQHLSVPVSQHYRQKDSLLAPLEQRAAMQAMLARFRRDLAMLGIGMDGSPGETGDGAPGVSDPGGD